MGLTKFLDQTIPNSQTHAVFPNMVISKYTTHNIPELNQTFQIELFAKIVAKS